jgi:hypothetical protein
MRRPPASTENIPDAFGVAEAEEGGEPIADVSACFVMSADCCWLAQLAVTTSNKAKPVAFTIWRIPLCFSQTNRTGRTNNL